MLLADPSGSANFYNFKNNKIKNNLFNMGLKKKLTPVY